MTAATEPQPTKMTLEEFQDEAIRRFGDDSRDWAFVCPSCGDVADGHNFRAALDTAGRETEKASDRLGQECIGRTLGALAKGEPYAGRGCDWAAYGLFRGPVIVTMPDEREVGVFRFATRKEV